MSWYAGPFSENKTYGVVFWGAMSLLIENLDFHYRCEVPVPGCLKSSRGIDE